jgi:hypothetical protein
MPRESSIPGEAAFSAGNSMPMGIQHAQGDTACPGGAAFQGKQHAKGEQHAQGEQYAGGSSIKGLYILHSLSSISCKGAL